MRFVELNQLTDIHVADAIAVGHHERLIANIRLDALDAAARHGIQAGIYHRNLPRLAMLLMNDHIILSICKIKGNITVMQEIVCKPILDDMLLVSRTNHKLVKAKIGVFLHDVPQNRLPTNFHHGLWFKL